MNGTRTSIAALVAAALTVVLAPATAASGDSGPRAPRLAWEDCGGGFECATARVPLDYDRPGGRSIELALTRLPATDRAVRIGSLFVNPGGPGNSGVDYVREVARTGYPAEVRARFDIVGMDPRGVGASTPVRCFADADAQLPRALPRRPDAARARHHLPTGSRALRGLIPPRRNGEPK